MFDGSIVMSFCTWNCPTYLVCSVNKYRNQCRTRAYPALAVQPSSILLHTDDNGNWVECKRRSGSRSAPSSNQTSSSLLSQANTVGIIGGVSAVSTLNFLEKLIFWSSKDGEENLPFVVCSDPVLNKELLSHERSGFPYLNTKTAPAQLDHTSVVENLQHKRAFLEHSGARCIVMPCHILHKWHGEVSQGCSIPFLHVGECIALELKEANLKPVEAGSNVRIGVLATDTTLAAGFYQEKLETQFHPIPVMHRDLRLCCQTKQPWSTQSFLLLKL
uniref:Amino-acid racemase n=1 Tax=Nelumbo nucifera TaxID=4432 RepID=A0A822Y3V3_NELNU|nr:TPA_asm: hypothetical protein HUJ06_028575 [Nelumbo nucifera]